MITSGSLDIPNLLSAGDVVRVVAPAGPVSEPVLKAGISWLESVGLKPRYDDGLFTRESFLAGSDERRLAEFEAALDDADARAIWAARGGYGSTRLLPHLDLEKVRHCSKWLVGFSDVTALHGLWRRAGLASMHAANVATLDRWEADAREALRDALFNGGHATLSGSHGLGRRAVRGILAGGNLRVLAALLGTPYSASFEDCVLLIEDVNEPPYKIDRLLTQMTQAGMFDRVRGLAIGQLSGCDDDSNKPGAVSAEQVLREQADRLGVPAIFGLPVGHQRTSRSALLGTEVKLDPEALTISYI